MLPWFWGEDWLEVIALGVELKLGKGARRQRETRLKAISITSEPFHARAVSDTFTVVSYRSPLISWISSKHFSSLEYVQTLQAGINTLFVEGKNLIQDEDLCRVEV